MTYEDLIANPNALVNEVEAVRSVRVEASLPRRLRAVMLRTLLRWLHD